MPQVSQIDGKVVDKQQCHEFLVYCGLYTSLAWWEHHVNILLQSIRSVSSDLH